MTHIQHYSFGADDDREKESLARAEIEAFGIGCDFGREIMLTRAITTFEAIFIDMLISLSSSYRYIPGRHAMHQITLDPENPSKACYRGLFFFFFFFFFRILLSPKLDRPPQLNQNSQTP